MEKEMENKRKQWEKPQMIVLGRSKPEEGILAACKSTDGSPPGPASKCNPQNPPNCRTIADS